MTTLKILTDRSGDALQLYRDSDGVYATVRMSGGTGTTAAGPFATAELRQAVDGLEGDVATTEPRPLTPDAITDEMVERAAHCMAMREMPVTYSGDPTETADQFYDLPREVLHAALTEPPARPEGAEEIQRLLTEDLGHLAPPVTPEAIADLLASRGVRVVAKEY